PTAGMAPFDLLRRRGADAFKPGLRHVAGIARPVVAFLRAIADEFFQGIPDLEQIRRQAQQFEEGAVCRPDDEIAVNNSYADRQFFDLLAKETWVVGFAVFRLQLL